MRRCILIFFHYIILQDLMQRYRGMRATISTRRYIFNGIPKEVPMRSVREK